MSDAGVVLNCKFLCWLMLVVYRIVQYDARVAVDADKTDVRDYRILWRAVKSDKQLAIPKGTRGWAATRVQAPRKN